jgi:hypothetical protein
VRESQRIKAFDDADNPPMAVAKRSDPHMRWNAMPLFVAQLDSGLPGLSVVHRFDKGTGHATKHATLVVAVHQNIFAAEAPQDFMTAIASDSFGAVVPEQNLSFAAD